MPPLDPDPDKNGKRSDHMMVIFTPIDSLNDKCVKKTKEIKFRPLHDQGIEKMRTWLNFENWNEVLKQPSADLKAEVLQNILVSKVEEYFPERVRIISCNDQPFFNQKLSQLRRKKSREYNKHRKSIRYKKLEDIYQKEWSKAKKI